MKYLVFALWVGSLGLAGADDWKRHLSPRLRESFGPMLREDWKPQEAARLTPQEKEQMQNLWDRIKTAPMVPASPPVPPAPAGTPSVPAKP